MVVMVWSTCTWKARIRRICNVLQLYVFWANWRNLVEIIGSRNPSFDLQHQRVCYAVGDSIVALRDAGEIVVASEAVERKKLDDDLAYLPERSLAHPLKDVELEDFRDWPRASYRKEGLFWCIMKYFWGECVRWEWNAQEARLLSWPELRKSGRWWLGRWNLICLQVLVSRFGNGQRFVWKVRPFIRCKIWRGDGLVLSKVLSRDIKSIV